MRLMSLVCFLAFAMLVHGDVASTYLSFAKFPPGKIKGTGEYAYAAFIVNLHQKSLFDYPPGVDVYRFIDYESFSRGAMVVITKQDNHIQFESMEPAKQGYTISGEISDFSRPLSKSEWNAFNGLFQKSGFWNKSHYIWRDGSDGFDYILEARVDGHYHYVVRWVPGDYPEDKAFAQLGEWLNARVQRTGTISTNDGHDVVTKDGTSFILGK